ncbi:MAG: hypothetical protein ACR2OH_02955 [Microthrixaceae bacterium]
MYMFNRRVRLASADGLEWASRIAQRASEISGHQIDLWGTVYSEAFGTVSWTSWFENLEALQGFGDKLEASEEYQKLTAEGRELIDGGADDGLLQLIHGAPDPDADPQYVSGVTAVGASGNLERSMACGVDIAETATSITGLNTLFARSMTGPYGGIGWLTGYASLAEFEKAQDALAAEPSWIKLLDTTEGAFVEDPALTQSTIYRKLG